MEDRPEWVESTIAPGIGPEESLNFDVSGGLFANEADVMRVFPITIGLLSGNARSFVDEVNRFDRQVKEEKVLPRVNVDPVFAIPLAFQGPQESYQHPQASKARGADVPEVTWITLLVSGYFMSLMNLPAGSVSISNPAEGVWQFILGQSLPDDALPPDAEGVPVPLPEVTLPDEAPAKDVVVSAVIDDGLPIANLRFRNALTDSRVEYAWIQDGKFQPGSHVDYGREFTKPQIDDILTNSVVAGQVDEDDFYRRAGMADFADPHNRTRLGLRFTHGSNVMDQAAGYGPGASDKPGKNPIIAVQLPAVATADTSGGTFDTYVDDALTYILDRADRIAEDLNTAGTKTGKLNLVINFSYGFISGPHDGTQHLEQRMDQILKARNAKHEITAIVLPAGNSRQVRCHGQLEARKTGGAFTPDKLTWRVLPDDRTRSYVIAYMPPTNGPPGTSRIKVRLKTPTGVLSPDVSEVSGTSWVWTPNGSDVLAKVSYQFMGPPTNRGRFVFAIQPTRVLDPSKPIAPSGDWILEIENISLGPQEDIELYVQRDDTPFGFVQRGRQSYFIDPEYKRFTVTGLPVDDDDQDAYVKRAGTLNAIATGEETVVIGGYLRFQGYDEAAGEVARYSAAGPAEPRLDGTFPRVGPNALMVSDTSLVHFGVLGATTRSGSVFALNGTSISAPQVARKVAQSMALGAWTGPGTIAAWVPAAPVPPDPERKGLGNIDLPPVYPISSQRVEV